jgi:hypothetical protein
LKTVVKVLCAALITYHFSLLTSSCDSYLDELPDNRMEITSLESVQKLLVTAYPSNESMMVAEFKSDNVDDYGPTNPNTARFLDQVYSWSDITESSNSSPEMFWKWTAAARKSPAPYP